MTAGFCSSKKRKIMQRNSLERIARTCMETAVANLLAKGYAAFAVLLVKEDSIMPMQVIAPDRESRMALGNVLLALAPHVDAIFVVSEAWTLRPADMTDDAFNMPVSENPKRVESIFVTAQSRHGELLLTRVFERDSRNNPVVTEETTATWIESPVTAMGNFSNLFAACRET